MFKHVHLLVQQFENEEIISQINRSGEKYDQNGGKVSKNNKSCHICSMRLKYI